MKKAAFKSWVDHNSIMVINQKGHLRKLYCPFRVLCQDSIEDIIKSTWCYVDQVEMGDKSVILYSINGKKYPFNCFHIYIMF